MINLTANFNPGPGLKKLIAEAPAATKEDVEAACHSRAGLGTKEEQYRLARHSLVYGISGGFSEHPALSPLNIMSHLTDGELLAITDYLNGPNNKRSGAEVYSVASIIGTVASFGVMAGSGITPIGAGLASAAAVFTIVGTNWLTTIDHAKKNQIGNVLTEIIMERQQALPVFQTPVSPSDAPQPTP